MIPIKIHPDLIQRLLSDSDQNPARLSYSLLVYMIVVVFLITLIPFQFSIPENFAISTSGPLNDIITNILFFLPIGFLLRLSQKPGSDRACLLALVLGITVSLSVETCQLFIPGRSSTIVDVVTNGLGAWIGAVIAVSVRRKMNPADTHGMFAPELPLMSLMYLTFPLMLLNSLAAGDENDRLWLLFLLGIFGSGVIASVYTNLLKEDKRLKFAVLSLLVMGWFVTASIPVLLIYPREILGFGLVIALFVQIPARLARNSSKEGRRFELPTLKKLLPVYLIYLILLTTWPTTVPLNEWGHTVNFVGLNFSERTTFIFRFVEMIAAFTLFGFIIAEMRGRKKESFFKTLLIVFFIIFCSSTTLQILKVNSLMIPAIFLEPVFITLAGLFGAVIYRRQLSSIRR